MVPLIKCLHLHNRGIGAAALDLRSLSDNLQMRCRSAAHDGDLQRFTRATFGIDCSRQQFVCAGFKVDADEGEGRDLVLVIETANADILI